MASIRSNLNSVSNTIGGLTALKKRLTTTCFIHWRRKTAQGQHQSQQYYQNSYKYCYTAYFCENLKRIGLKLRKIISPTRNKHLKSSKPSTERNVQIVSKLLSSTLIATTITKTLSSATTVNCKEEEVGAEMTITDDSFLVIREEYPDLDAEVRSILMSRAQNGATISDIKEDYRKNTGMKFPIYNNVTEFLLSIPKVSAICNEVGTRIFNIVPTEKTQHIYDLVCQQKQSTYSRPSYLTRRSRMHQYVVSNNDDKAPVTWRSSNNQPDFNKNNRNGNYNYNNRVSAEICQPALEHQRHKQQPGNQNNSRNDSEGLMENNYYQDNCNHFYSRLYNQQNAPQFTAKNLKNNNNNAILNNNHGNFKNHQNNFDTQPENLNNNNYQQNNANKCKPSHAFGHFHSRPSRSSSPTWTRSSQTNESMYTSDSEYGAHLLDFPLVGDDFFLYLARMELKCKFKKFEKVLQSGLCVSGQTINAAIKRLRFVRDNERHVIVNIGSVDIMQGRPLVQIEHDFRTLVNVMHKKGMKPILTTLGPLANYSHEPLIKEKLRRFNQFIKREGEYLKVIDIWSCLVNERNQTLFDCFQNEPRIVSGTVEPYVFWNKIGRQRVLQLIESNIEY